MMRLLYYYFKTLYLNQKFVTRSKLMEYQQKKFHALAKNTLYRSPFYREYIGKPLNEWPVMNKSIMMTHFDEINTAGIQKKQAMALALQAENSRDFSAMIGDIAVGLSSGTSGNRGLFLASAHERDAWSGILLAKALPHSLFHPERIAFFLRANNRLYTNINRSKKISLHFFDLLDDFDLHIDRLNTLQPSILSAPASVLSALAREKKRLYIHPKKIFSVAEVLEAKDEAMISQAFACPVSQVYQCTEGFLGITDKHSHRLQLNEEYLVIEKDWIDEKRFVPIITDLVRTTQPIIRYRLDDVLIEEPSRGVFTQLSGIEGRLGDICYASKKGQIFPLFADLIRQKMASFLFDFNDYKIEQHALHQFTISITPDLPEKDDLIAHLNQLFLNQNYDIPSWTWVPYISPERGMKQRRIQVIPALVSILSR